MAEVDRQAEAVRKFTRKVKRLRKELGRRTEGGANWKKTRARLDKVELQLSSALAFYKCQGGTDQGLITEAERLI